MALPSSFPYKIVLFISWLILQAAIWYSNGINTGGESIRFIREAGLLENGDSFTSPAFYLYLGQILLLAMVHTLGTGYTLIVILQLLLNALALNNLYNFILMRHKSRKVAFLAGMLLVACIPYQLYNTFLYTESIFFSLVLIYTIQLLSVKKWKGDKILMIIAWLAVLCMVRPTGLFVALVTLVFVALQIRKINLIAKLLLLIPGIILFLFAVHSILKTGGGINPLTPFIYEHIICDVPQSEVGRKLFLNTGSEGLNALSYYIAHNPGHFLQLAVKKTIAFFGLHRPWYSTVHNLLLMFYFFGLYAMMIIALFRRGLTSSFLFSVCLITIFWLFVVFSCDEWHNRFFLTFTPHLIICAMGAFGKKERKLKTPAHIVRNSN